MDDTNINPIDQNAGTSTPLPINTGDGGLMTDNGTQTNQVSSQDPSGNVSQSVFVNNQVQTPDQVQSTGENNPTTLNPVNGNNGQENVQTNNDQNLVNNQGSQVTAPNLNPTQTQNNNPFNNLNTQQLDSNGTISDNTIANGVQNQNTINNQETQVTNPEQVSYKNGINNGIQNPNINTNQETQTITPEQADLENGNNNGIQDDDEIDYPENWDVIEDLRGKILSVATLNKVSDIYVVSGYEVGMKVHGQICKLEKLGILDESQVNDFLYSIFEEKQKAEFIEDLEIDFAYSWSDFDGSDRRFRVNAFHQSKKPSATLRYLVNENNTIDSLNLPEILKTLSERNSGIVLVCGITGSGKSTTIAAMIDHINANSSKHIISIEDPVEYTFEKKKSWIEQREVGTDTRTFKRAMKSALRQNPNVLFLGEMRDLESISAAITIAESGHLVLSTIHARNSIQCINKIIDGFPAAQQNQIRIQISEALAAILTQKLIPSKTGKGVELVMEIMINNSAIANLIRESQTHQLESIIQTSAQEGMKLLDSNIIELVKEDKISTKDAIKYSNDPESMEKVLKDEHLLQ